MDPIIIVLIVVLVVLVLGGIVFGVLRGKKKNAGNDNTVAPDTPKTTEGEVVPKASETETAEAGEPENIIAADETQADRADNVAEVNRADEEKPDKVESANDVKDETASSDEKKDDAVANADNANESDAGAPVENAKKRRFAIKYSRSFLAKLIQSGDQAKRYYSELKNKLLLYKGVKSRIAWKSEAFRKGRKTIAKLRLRGKTLSLTLALDPNAYTGTEYRVESLVEIKSYATTPCLYRIKNNRRLAYAKELIEELATKNDLTERTDVVNTDYAAQYPYEETDALIERKLIKVLADKTAHSKPKLMPSEIREEVAATEVDKIMTDETAASLIEKSNRRIDKTKQGIINIDTLSQNFASGEVVTLAEIKKRVKGYQKTTYIKVLARGTLDKPLTVEADSFSLQAVKMIVLTGGKVVKNCV